MGKKSSSKSAKDEPASAPQSPFNNPFGKLDGLRAQLPTAPQLPEKPPAEKPQPKGPARAVVRMERKGHGGKEVTVVEQLGLSLRERDVWLKALKQSLGCGGVVDGDVLQLQGDQRERLPALLEKRGVRKVIIG